MNIENLLGKLKQNVSQKTYGFFVTLALVVLNIVTAILYASFRSEERRPHLQTIFYVFREKMQRKLQPFS